MRIKKLELKNVGVFEDLNIEFPKCPKGKAEIHIITGENGSGKSTLLKALASVFDYTTSFADICPKETNKFVKYLNPSMGIDLDICKGLVQFEEEDEIRFYGCNKGRRNHIHTPTASTKLRDYKEQLNPDHFDKRPDYLFSFAVFAYSGYRFVDFVKETTPDFNKKKENPLYQSLDFVKVPNPSYSLDNWIITSLLKRAYAIEKKMKNKVKNYSETVERLSQAISKIIGFPLSFRLDENLRYVNILYDHFLELDIEVIPDGLKSLISWLGDLCMRLEGLDWDEDIPVFDRKIILFLDEIENHLHIKWQRMVLPVIQELLPNAQIFITTHSPFILNSTDDAWIYKLTHQEHKSTISKPIKSDSSNSYILEVIRTLGLDSEYGFSTQLEVDKFYEFKEAILNNEAFNKEEFLALVEELTKRSPSLNSEIRLEFEKLKDYID